MWGRSCGPPKCSARRRFVGTLHHSAPETGALAKTASGALERQPYLRERNLADAMERLRSMGYVILGLDGEADQTIDDALAPVRGQAHCAGAGSRGSGVAAEDERDLRRAGEDPLCAGVRVLSTCRTRRLWRFTPHGSELAIGVWRANIPDEGDAMPHGTKIATCCYCGTRAALVLKGESRHELSCSACGAPLHEMKMLHAKPAERPAATQHRHASQPKTAPAPFPAWDRDAKRAKEDQAEEAEDAARRFLEEAFDVIEDIFD